MSPEKPPLIYVIAGVNGAGKSSIQGAAILRANGHYYNPDEAATRLRLVNPELTQIEANSIAWHNGVELLRKAIKEKLDYSFESTLGANTIPDYYATPLMKDFTFASGTLVFPVQSCTLLGCAGELPAGGTSFLKVTFDAVTNGAVSI